MTFPEIVTKSDRDAEIPFPPLSWEMLLLMTMWCARLAVIPARFAPDTSKPSSFT